VFGEMASKQKRHSSREKMKKKWI